MEILFQNPRYLWLLLSLPFLVLIHFFSLRFLRTRAWIFANYEAIKKVSGLEETMRNTHIIRKNLTLLMVQVLVIVFIILATAEPMYVYIGQSSEQSYVLAIDNSGSMLADDFAPDRLEAAKKAALLFMDRLPQRTSVGIVSFAGTSFVESQMTENLGILKEIIDTIGVSRIGGTDIGGALVSAGNLLAGQTRSKTIILITDGRTTVGTPVSEGIDYAISKGIVVHTIGMGTEEGGSFIRGDVVSTLDVESLQLIADSTKGSFFLAETGAGLSDAFESIISAKAEKISVPLQLPMILIALSLIFLQWGLINTRYRTLP